MKVNLFFCAECWGKSASNPNDLKCGCNSKKIIKGTFTVYRPKKPKWQRFINFIIKDMGYVLAFMAAVVINTILLPHLHLSFTESLIEAVCLGLILPRLFKENK